MQPGSTSRAAATGMREAGDAETSTSAVAWAPVIGGAFAAAALSLILIALGSGLGLAAVSPWPNAGSSATTFTVMTAIWLIIVHWFASGFGGYLTGRLRTKWVGLHTHEVFFRDTAHGLLTWATATVLATALFASATSTLIAGGAKATASVASGAAQGAASNTDSSTGEPSSYFVDMLYRSDNDMLYRSDNSVARDTDDRQVRAETGRILAAGLKNGDVSPADRTYLAQLVAARTKLSQPEAEKRVDDVIAQAKNAELKARQAADQARKAGAYVSLFTALAMVIGAFIAAVAGGLGGSHRDEWSSRLALMR